MSDVKHNPKRVARRPQARGGAGFTLVELLVTVSIIIILLSLLVVGLSAATRASQRASTQALMSEITKGLVTFKGDIGYLPPVLDEDRALDNVPDPDSAGYAPEMQDWYSITTIAEYLVGYGPGLEDGYGYPAANETPALGIRHSGADGVWGAATRDTNSNSIFGELADRNPPLDGKKYGPYLALADDNLLGSIDVTEAPDPLGNPIVHFPGDPKYNAAHPHVIVDYWGVPIRYYRRPYPPGALAQSYRAIDRTGDLIVDRVPTLSDVYLLRPWSMKAGSEVAGALPDANDTNQGLDEGITTAELQAAAFAVFSPGPDKSWDQASAVDTDELNKDNIVGVSP